MEKESIHLRPARPDYEEGLVAANYIEMSSEGLIPSVLGKDYRRIVAEAFTQPNNDFSYQNAVFAELDGKIVGMGFGFTGAYHAASSDLPVRNAPGNRFRRKIGLGLLNFFVRMMGGYPEHDFYVAFMGVDESCRGMGIGTQLLQAMEQMAKQQNAHRLALHVSGGNDGAKKLYQRFGLEEEADLRKRKFPPRIGCRMVKPLD